MLNAGLLELTARAEAPRLKLGWFRFYKRFLVRTPLPKWPTLSTTDQLDLQESGEGFNATFRELFGFSPGD
ncbi:MAG TPA: hypothetical protein VLQ65_02735, partial [Saliniramus sp.]|nr:hypothetical protein [Saliniramus sp.]